MLLSMTTGHVRLSVAHSVARRDTRMLSAAAEPVSSAHGTSCGPFAGSASVSANASVARARSGVPPRVLRPARPNGAGKTTALRALLGLSPGNSGEVRVFALPIRRKARGARALRVVPQADTSIRTSR